MNERMNINTGVANKPFGMGLPIILLRMLLLNSICSITLLMGQTDDTTEQWEKPYSLSIQDNSFFIEEAFNQEERVVQHISGLSYFATPISEFQYTFTQEWPLGGVHHQLSFTLPYASSGGVQGLSDIMLNYRYQLLDKVDGIAIAPRISIQLPTGDEMSGLGTGVFGFETNIPMSKRLTEGFIAHANMGVNVLPNAHGTTNTGIEVKRTLATYKLGASGIFLVHPDVNLMLEYVAAFAGELDGNGDVTTSTEQILSPGVRVAINFENLQIVPGMAMPVRFHDGQNEVGVFGYLSFEHGF
jgi:hypothetical protein